MDISQIVGFIISVLAIIYIVTKRGKEERLRKEHPEEHEKEQQKQQDQLKQFLKSLDVEMEDKKQKIPPPKPVQKPPVSPASKTVKKEPLPPKPKRIVSDEFTYRTDLDDVHLKNDISQRKLKSHIEDKYKDIYGDRVVSVDLREESNRAYEVIQKTKVSRGEKLLQRMPTKKNMVILYEIFGTPKGMQK